MSTLQAEFAVSSTQTGKSYVNLTPYDFDLNHSHKRKCNAYMTEYKKKRKAEKGISEEEREKCNEYMKNYGAKKNISSFGFQSFMTWCLKRAVVYLHLLRSAVVQT